MADEKKESKTKFKANWELHGLRKEPVEIGQVVELTAKEAAPFVECGVLSPLEG